MSAQNQAPSSPSLGDVTGLAAFCVGLASAWLYLAGWTYAYHYFDRFGVPLLMVDIPKEHYFVYGAWVVREYWIAVLLVSGAAIAVTVTRPFLPVAVSRHARAILLVGIAIAFWLAHIAGAAAAIDKVRAQRLADYDAYPRIQVWLNEGPAAASVSPRPQDLAGGCHRLLLHNQDRLFLIRPVKGASAAALPLVIVPWDSVETSRVLPEYTSCR